MRNRQEWFDEKVAAIPKDVREEVNLSSEIIIRIDEILRRKGMTQRELARKLGKSEAVVSRWTTGFPNLTLRSIAQLSEALGESLIQVTKD
jgi:transcriptional regulator with XRE-family HTH domain